MVKSFAEKHMQRADMKDLDHTKYRQTVVTTLGKK